MSSTHTLRRQSINFKRWRISTTCEAWSSAKWDEPVTNVNWTLESSDMVIRLRWVGTIVFSEVEQDDGLEHAVFPTSDVGRRLQELDGDLSYGDILIALGDA